MNAVSEVQTVEATSIVEHDAPDRATLTPMLMLERAVSQGANIEVLEKLMGLQERWEANQARKAFDEAMAAAKAEIPVIVKNQVVEYEGKSSASTTRYRHEDLGEIARVVTPILARHGLSYRFRTHTGPNEPVSVTCIVSHRAGHFEENTLTAGADSSGQKNSIQAIGSAITYLQRYTLKASLGLAAAADDDGQGADGGRDPITEDQLAELRATIDEVGADIPAFCRYLGVGSLADIPQSQFERAIKALEAKGKRS